MISLNHQRVAPAYPAPHHEAFGTDSESERIPKDEVRCTPFFVRRENTGATAFDGLLCKVVRTADSILDGREGILTGDDAIDALARELTDCGYGAPVYLY